ncbi:MAG TPA: helix-turn-helix transcriptional regulator [Planctomycetota bacterium]|nr:helix-turn-helix transcriptional regulator [Planctomycetota bacterium]
MKRILKNPEFTHWVRTEEPLLWISGAGHEIISPDDRYFFDCRGRLDTHWGLQLTLLGTGYYERNGKATLLKPGMAWCDQIPGDFRYGLPPGTTEDYQQVWIDMVGPAAEAFWQHIWAAYGRVLTLGPDNRVAPLMLTIARQHATGAHHDRYMLAAQLYELLMTLLSTLSQTRVETSPVVKRATQLMKKQGLDGNCTVERVARELGCSREHLTREFKEAMGVGPADFLAQHRLRQAAIELRSTEDKLETIAARCGFSNATYFCRVFRKHKGMSPGDYRRRPWRL